MSFDSIPEDRKESFPCECGGSITKNHQETEYWECDQCSMTYGKRISDND